MEARRASLSLIQLTAKACECDDSDRWQLVTQASRYVESVNRAGQSDITNHNVRLRRKHEGNAGRALTRKAGVVPQRAKVLAHEAGGILIVVDNHYSGHGDRASSVAWNPLRTRMKVMPPYVDGVASPVARRRV